MKRSCVCLRFGCRRQFTGSWLCCLWKRVWLELQHTRSSAGSLTRMCAMVTRVESVRSLGARAENSGDSSSDDGRCTWSIRAAGPTDTADANADATDSGNDGDGDEDEDDATDRDTGYDSDTQVQRIAESAASFARCVLSKCWRFASTKVVSRALTIDMVSHSPLSTT